MNDIREYSIWNTPLSMLLRGRIGPGADPLATVRQSDLPEAAKEMIAQVVKKTRLWKYERQEIAEEMVAHFADGISAGGREEDLIADFGAPRKAAKLMRRAKKRNRPLWWKLMHGTTQATLCVMLLYAGLIVLYFTGHPSPAIDYIPRVNAVAASAPADQCAWPIYRQAWAGTNQFEVIKFLQGMGPQYADRHAFAADDPDRVATAAFLNSHAALIASMREAAAKPYFGLVVATAGHFKPEDAEVLLGSSERVSLAGTQEHALDSALIGIMLPHLAPLRSMSLLMTLDMANAAAQDDGARVVTDYGSVLGMARHAREHPTWVSQMVSQAMIGAVDERLAWIIQDHPAVLRGREVALLHEMTNVQDAYALNVAFERDVLLDIIQHSYTDSGAGGGRLTYDGMKTLDLFRLVTGNQKSPKLSPDTPRGLAVLVTLAAARSSRRDATSYVNQYCDLMQQDLARPAWEQLTRPAASTEYADGLRKSAPHDPDVLPVIMIAPSLEHTARRIVQMRAVHDVLMVGLALEVYASRTGRYPMTLSELVPQYLPEAPLDLSTGQPLLYKLKDGRPLLYGRGLDGKDDGGVWIEDKATVWPNVPARGDWVLYPKPESVEPAKQ